MAKNQENKNAVNEDIPRNTKETSRRLLNRLGRQKRKLIVIVVATLLSSAAFTALPLAVGKGIDAWWRLSVPMTALLGSWRRPCRFSGCP